MDWNLIRKIGIAKHQTKPPYVNVGPLRRYPQTTVINTFAFFGDDEASSSQRLLLPGSRWLKSNYVHHWRRWLESPSRSYTSCLRWVVPISLSWLPMYAKANFQIVCQNTRFFILYQSMQHPQMQVPRHRSTNGGSIFVVVWLDHETFPQNGYTTRFLHVFCSPIPLRIQTPPRVGLLLSIQSPELAFFRNSVS